MAPCRASSLNAALCRLADWGFAKRGPFAGGAQPINLGLDQRVIGRKKAGIAPLAKRR